MKLTCKYTFLLYRHVQHSVKGEVWRVLGIQHLDCVGRNLLNAHASTCNMIWVFALACLHLDMFTHCMDCCSIIRIAIADKMAQTAASIPK
jgi:hypothetical protein